MAFTFERVEHYGRVMDSAVVTVHLERRGHSYTTHFHAEIDGVGYTVERYDSAFDWHIGLAAYAAISRLLEREGRPLWEWHPAIIDTAVDLANNRAFVRFVIYGPDTEPALSTATGNRQR
jgi:hypothetical protein